MKTRVKTAIYGLVTANAMAIPVLYRGLAEHYKDIETMQSDGFLNQPPGTFGDAAEMTLCIAESVGQKQALDYDDMMVKLQKWELSPASLFSVEAVVPAALARHKKGIPALECGLCADFGTAAYRMLPVAIHLYLKYGENMLFYEETMKNIWQASAITHTNIESFAFSALFCGLIGKLLAGKSFDEAVDISLMVLRKYFCQKGYSLNNLWNYIVTKDDIYVQPCQLASNHPVSAVFDWATFLMFRGDDYRQNVVRAVNARVPEPDMLAAVVGCLSGILYGYDAIPAEWISHVRSDRIDCCCKLLEEYWDRVVLERGIGYGCESDVYWWK